MTHGADAKRNMTSYRARFPFFIALLLFLLEGNAASAIPAPRNLAYTVPALSFTSGNGNPPFGDETGGYFTVTVYQPEPINGVPQQPLGYITVANIHTTAAPNFNPQNLPKGYPASDYTANGSDVRLYSSNVIVSPWPASAQFDFHDPNTNVTMVINIPDFDPRSADNQILYIQEIYQDYIRGVSSSATIDPCTSANPCTPPCGDERDDIIRAYAQYHVQLRPTCESFTESAASQYYSFSDLNTGDFSWALIRLPLTTEESPFGLTAWDNALGTIKHINSAYRDPQHNSSVGGRPQSRHLFGDAVDLQNYTRTYAEYLQAAEAAHTADADYVEPFAGPCKNGCIHADWRLHSGPYDH